MGERRPGTGGNPDAAVDERGAHAARRRMLLRVVGSAVTLGLLLLLLPASEIWAALRSVSPFVWGVSVAAYLTLHLLGVSKWRLLVNTMGSGLPFRQAARAYYVGLFGNLFLPSIVGGDVARAGMALRTVQSKSGLILGSLIDRIQDVVALGLLAGVGAILSPRALDASSRRVFVVFLATLAMGAAVGALVLWFVPLRRVSFKHRRKLVPVRRAMRAAMASPHTLASALAAGVTLQGALVLLNAWLGHEVGIDIPLYVWLFVWPLAKLSGLLPLTQGGIGVREAALAALFAPFGVSAAKAVATGLVFETVIICGGLLSGAIALALRDPARQDAIAERASREATTR